MCSGVRFVDNNGKMFFGRNLDWSVGYGERILVTPRNYEYSSAFLGSLKNKYGIIGMGIVQENVPLYFDCGNEAGLAIAGLNFPGYANYESDAVEGKKNVAAYEFPLWILMNFSSVDEVEKELENVAIVAKPINDKYPVSLLHWIIGDSKRSIVVEYTENGMEIFHNDADVLTNQPGYGWHKENLRNYMNLSNVQPESVKLGNVELKPFGSGSMMRGIPGDYYSTSRFVRLAYLNANYPMKESEEDNVNKLFQLLNGVKMIEGAALMTDGNSEKTVYTGCFSEVTKTYYWNTYEDFSIKKSCMNDFDLDSSEILLG
ncbi:choloylglycine hydrolase [Candidatus Saccharibacteria bacterium]|nr:choloylglycine hydrolase [Candidatus Saccharibacteria bacterium]